MDTQNNASKTGGSGPLVGIVIIILLLAAGGFYFFQKERGGDFMKASSPATDTDPQTEALKATSLSDTASSLEDDLDSTDLGDINSELSDIEAQL